MEIEFLFKPKAGKHDLENWKLQISKMKGGGGSRDFFPSNLLGPFTMYRN